MPRRIPRDDLGLTSAENLKVLKQVSKYVELAYITDLKKKLRSALRAEKSAKKSFNAYGPNLARSRIEDLEDKRMELESCLEGVEQNYLKVTKHFSPGWEKTV